MVRRAEPLPDAPWDFDTMLHGDGMRIGEVLELRAWVLRSLALAPSAPPSCSPASWRFFLRTERCALPLKARLVASGRYGMLEQESRHALDTAAGVELQRVLSARAQLLLIDRLAAEHGWVVVVLKAGVAAMTDRDAVDLADIDVLARSDDARALAAALDSAGYRADGASSPLHLAGRVAEGGLKVEVHTRIDMVGCPWSESVWTGVTPLAATMHLCRFAPRDHLWHLLVHVGVLHPYRRGAIRDLLLLSQALTPCSDGDLADVTAELETHPYAHTLQDMLSMARGLAGTAPLEDRFTYQASVASLVSWQGRWLPVPDVIRADVGKWAVALIAGRADMRREWGRVRMVTTGPSLSRPIAWIERRAPRLGRGVRVTSRVMRVVFATVLAAPLALLAAYAAARATKARPRTTLV
jgi:hypothetical protein